MSSVYVRDQITNFLVTKAPTQTFVDMTSIFQEINEFLADNDVQPDAPWIGLEFNGSDEIPVQLSSGNATGKYRETGIVQVHIVEPARLGVGNAILNRGEPLRNLLRGVRIGNILIESVSPIVTGEGATLNFEDGYLSGSFFVSYVHDFDLGG